MKKTLLNTAITLAFSSAILSSSVLAADNTTSNDTAAESYLYPGMGVGAASGALVAGPVGLLVGGLIGAIAGANQQVSTEAEPITRLTVDTTDDSPAPNNIQSEHDKNDVLTNTSEQPTFQQGTQVAQIGAINTAIDNPIETQQETLLNILTSDLSLDVYFRSGSTSIESFYPARLAAIADLMNTMDQLELHLDGYTDRRGDKTENIALANQRIEKVREQLIAAGVDANRIISKAFGEIKMVSRAGDLDAYTFDRKVVIRFQRTTADSISAMTATLSEFETEKTDAVVTDTRIDF